MSGTITLSDGTNTATISKPEYGYEVEVSMPITFYARSGTSYGVHDATATYDMRIARSVTFDIDATDMDELADLLRDIDKGRGVDLTLSLGTTSGWFPFGPDKGDSGDFVVRVVSFRAGGQQHRPWKYWRPQLDIAYVGGPTPAYTVSDTLADGGVQVGTVTGLKYPQGDYDADVRYKLQNIMDQASNGRAIDLGAVADEYESSFVFSGNTGKMGALAAYLVATGRGNNITFVTPGDNYPFGRDKAASGSFTVQCLYSEVGEDNRVRMRLTHDGFDSWSLPLRLRWVS